MNQSKKQSKINQKQNKKNEQIKLNYATQEYVEPQIPSGKHLIDAQIDLLDKIQQRKEDSKSEEIKMLNFKGIRNDLKAYNYQPLYMVNHEGKANLDMTDQELAKHVHLIYYWELNQTKLQNLPKPDIDNYIQKYRNGEMLEPLRQTFLTDQEMNIFIDTVEHSLTDGIIDYLRQIYDPEMDYTYLTESQKSLINKFVQYLPEYKIVLLNQEMPFDKQAFISTHRITYSVKISRQIHKDNAQLCDVFIRYQRFSDYNLSLNYFQQQKLEVLVDQKFNYTKEVLEALLIMYKAEKKNVHASIEKNASIESVQIGTFNNLQPREPSFKINLDFMQPGYKSPERQISQQLKVEEQGKLHPGDNQLQEEILSSNQNKEKTAIVEVEENSFSNNQDKEKTGIIELEEMSQQDKTNIIELEEKIYQQEKNNIIQVEEKSQCNNQDQDKSQVVEPQKKKIVKRDPKETTQYLLGQLDDKIQQNKSAQQKSMNVILLDINEKHKIIQDKISTIKTMIEKIPVIKQTFQIAGKQMTIQQVLLAYQSINSNIENSRRLNQKINNQYINEFFRQYKTKSIENVLQTIRKCFHKYFE